MAVEISFSSVLALPPIFSHCWTWFYGFTFFCHYSTQIPPLLLSSSFEIPPVCKFPSVLCEKGPSYPCSVTSCALQVIQNCVGWFYCCITLQTDIQFSACYFPLRGWGVFSVLFYCFANISSSFNICVLDYFSPDEPGCNFLGWIPFHFLPYFWPLQVL